MSIRTTLPFALLSALTMTAGSTFAAGTIDSTNPEKYFSSPQTPVMKTRAEVLAELTEFRRNPVSPDGWQYIGGEREWALIPHSYDYRDGKLVHTDPFDHNAPKASAKLFPDEQARSQVLYKNAQ